MLMKQSKMHSQVTLISSLNKEVLNSYEKLWNELRRVSDKYKIISCCR